MMLRAGATSLAPACVVTMLAQGTRLSTARLNCRQIINASEARDQLRLSVRVFCPIVEFLSLSIGLNSLRVSWQHSGHG